MTRANWRARALAALRWLALTAGVTLLLIELYDICVTPGIDWFWIALAILQIYVARPLRWARPQQ